MRSRRAPSNGEYEDIRRTLAEARKDLGYTKLDVAFESGYALTTVTNWEKHGHTPSVAALINWANALGYRLVVEKIDEHSK